MYAIRSYYAIRQAPSPVKGALRLVFELSGESRPSLFTLGPQAHYGHRLVLDLTGVAGKADVRQSVASEHKVPATPVAGKIIPMSASTPVAASTASPNRNNFV